MLKSPPIKNALLGCFRSSLLVVAMACKWPLPFQNRFPFYVGKNSLFKMNFEIFSKARGIVVSDSLGVAEALEKRRSFENLLGDKIGRRFVDRGQVLHHQLGRLRFATSRFAGNDDNLVLLLSVFAELRVR